MRKETISLREMCNFIRSIFDVLYREDEKINPDKNWDSDTASAIGDLFHLYGLAPDKSSDDIIKLFRETTSRDKKKSTDFVLLRVPVNSWQTLRESLVLDSKSAACDPALRKMIAAALQKVEETEVFTVSPKGKQPRSFMSTEAAFEIVYALARKGVVSENEAKTDRKAKRKRDRQLKALDVAHDFILNNIIR